MMGENHLVKKYIKIFSNPTIKQYKPKNLIFLISNLLKNHLIEKLVATNALIKATHVGIISIE